MNEILSIDAPGHLKSIYLSIHLSLYPSMYLSIYSSIYMTLFIKEVPLNEILSIDAPGTGTGQVTSPDPPLCAFQIKTANLNIFVSTEAQVQKSGTVSPL